MPSTPKIISGTISDSYGNISSNASIIFVNITDNNSLGIISGSDGKYVFDSASINADNGDTIIWSCYDKFKNEFKSGTFIVNENLVLNISLEIIDNANSVRGNRDVQVYNIGGKPVSGENPFPVSISKIPVGDGSLNLSYDSNNNLVTIIKSIGGNTYTRTLGYDANNNLVSVSRWVVG